jgi:hypothetical protein
MWRVSVAYEFFAFNAFHAIKESVSYIGIEGPKVQAPPPACIAFEDLIRGEATRVRSVESRLGSQSELERVRSLFEFWTREDRSGPVLKTS